MLQCVQVGLWAFGLLAHGRLVEAGRVAGCVFLAFVSVAAALGFLVYGGRLFLMLQRFPIESRGRTKKLREVRHCCWRFRLWSGLVIFARIFRGSF